MSWDELLHLLSRILLALAAIVGLADAQQPLGEVYGPPAPAVSAEPRPTHTPKPTTKPKPKPAHIRIGKNKIAGLATWYDDGPGFYAAAGPTLRSALGKNWRGKHVTVCFGKQCTRVVLSDWCACGKRHGVPTALDLSRTAFSGIASLGRGVVRVTVSW